MIQTSFSNPDVLPRWINRVEKKEGNKDREERKSHAGGTMIIEPSEDMNCSLDKFVSDLERAGFVLESASCQKRIHGKQKDQFYWMARFIFVHREDLQANEEFDQIKYLIYSELRKIFKEALWRVRAFRNPFFVEEEEVVGVCMLSVNCEARKPIHTIDRNQLVTVSIKGKEITAPTRRPVMEWLKDRNGQKIGDGPVAVQAKCHLRVQDGEVRLVKA
jgi:hypothetical protein